jgi:hypothetical protein
MPHTFHTVDSQAEASHVSVNAVPGAVFVRLRREQENEVVRRMFIELSVEEAVSLIEQLSAAIGTAGTRA